MAGVFFNSNSTTRNTPMPYTESAGGHTRTHAVTPRYLSSRGAAIYLAISYASFRKIATKIKRARTGRYAPADLDHYATDKKSK